MVGSWKARLDSDNMQEETGSNTTTQTSTVTYLLLVFAMLYGTLRQRRLSTTRLSVWIDFFDKHSRRKRSRTPHGPFGADLLVYALALFLSFFGCSVRAKKLYVHAMLRQSKTVFEGERSSSRRKLRFQLTQFSPPILFLSRGSNTSSRYNHQLVAWQFKM